MKKYVSIISLMTFLLMAYRLPAQDTGRLGLEDVFGIIDANYPQLQGYASKAAAVRALTDGAKAWMPPTLAVSLDRFPYQTAMIKEKTPDNQAGIMISVQQMIPNPARTSAKQRYLASMEMTQYNQLAWQKNVLHYTAKIYYYRRYVAERKLRVVGDFRELLKLLINTAKDKYTFNQAELGNIFKAEATLSELSNMETMLFSQVAESNIGLNTLMARDISTPFYIDTLLSVNDQLNGILPEADSFQPQRSDILAMQNRIRTMELNRQLMATGSRPDFGIQVAHSQMFGMANQFSVMGMITIPIAPWSSRMYKSEVRSMQFEIESMQQDVKTMQLMTIQMIGEKKTMLQYEKKQLDNYDREILPSYRKNLESNLLAYRQNTGNFFVLLDSWNMLFMKELEQMDKLGQVFALQSDYEYQKEAK